MDIIRKQSFHDKNILYHTGHYATCIEDHKYILIDTLQVYIMQKWKENLKECTIIITHDPQSGYQSCIEKSVIENLGELDHIKSVFKERSKLEFSNGVEI